MAQGFLARIAGRTKQISATVVSAGASDAGKIPGLGSAGRLDMSLMPVGIGANTTTAPASEALGAGSFVNFWGDAGTLSVRLADSHNGRQADGYVITAVAPSAAAAVYPLDGTNAQLTGLVAGARYWLGPIGGVTATPLDETDVTNANKISQYLGVGKSATELITDDLGFVVL